MCSYEVTDEYGEVISNILFFPEAHERERYFWNVLYKTPPKEFDIRTYKHCILGPCGKQFIHADSPFELSRAWACSLIGAFVVMVRILLTN